MTYYPGDEVTARDSNDNAITFTVAETFDGVAIDRIEVAQSSSPPTVFTVHFDPGSLKRWRSLGVHLAAEIAIDAEELADS
ncbi:MULTISPECIES: hypothetical protein [Mycolicibacterium]|uniref:hypothetical protein n=1 Tax=Mycolicibacterium TaxID=1866885 RepID=UPI00262742B0|nr:hypothetical protein [Mycolicibacterium fortuitum]